MIKIDFKQRKREVLWTVVALFFIAIGVSPEPRDCWFESKALLVLNPKGIGLKGRSGRFRTNGIMPTEDFELFLGQGYFFAVDAYFLFGNIDHQRLVAKLFGCFFRIGGSSTPEHGLYTGNDLTQGEGL